ncbi:MAG: septum formation initiator family protein [Candidatus Marinimicrobia bacterium]|nr:septum formation initiator family protein [Candidatus Neomarinimicrobiota bacterium]
MTRIKIYSHKSTGIIRWLDNPILFFVLIFLIIIASLVAYMYVRNGLNSISARNLALRNECIKKQQEIIYLKSEVIDLSRPGYIQSIAREQLGMVNSIPQADAIIVKTRKQ